MRFIVIESGKYDAFETECSSEKEAFAVAERMYDNLCDSDRKQKQITVAKVDDDYGEMLEDGSIKSDIVDILWDSWEFVGDEVAEQEIARLEANLDAVFDAMEEAY